MSSRRWLLITSRNILQKLLFATSLSILACSGGGGGGGGDETPPETPESAVDDEASTPAAVSGDEPTTETKLASFFSWRDRDRSRWLINNSSEQFKR